MRKFVVIIEDILPIDYLPVDDCQCSGHDQESEKTIRDLLDLLLLAGPDATDCHCET